MKIQFLESEEIKLNFNGGFAIHVMPEVGLVGFSRGGVNLDFDISIEEFKEVAKIIHDKKI